MVLKSSRKRNSRKQKRSRIYKKNGGIAKSPLYIVYCKILIEDIPNYQIIYIANSLESARRISTDLITIDNIKPVFYKELVLKENNLVHTIIPNEPGRTGQIEVIKPLKTGNILDGSDNNMLYFIPNENGIVQCIYDNLEIANRHYPGRHFEQLAKNTVNWNSIVFV